jgi:hypothetical protein
VSKDTITLNKIIKTLSVEIEDGQDVANAVHRGDVTTDGTDDIIYGRWELATVLLNQIHQEFKHGNN